MQGVLATKLAVLVELKSVRIVLVLHCVVVSLLAFTACESDSNAHFRDLLFVFSRLKANKNAALRF